MRVHRLLAAFGGVAAVMIPAASAGADAGVLTQHLTFDASQPFVGPCDGIPGVLTTSIEEILHVTDTGRTFNVVSNQRGSFSFDPDDAGLSTLTGTFVSHHHESVNFGQLKDYRITDSIWAVGVDEEGDRTPITVATTVLFEADGGVTVNSTASVATASWWSEHHARWLAGRDAKRPHHSMSGAASSEGYWRSLSG